MRLIDATLPTPAENLALDEALLACGGDEALRLWEADAPFVVLGRSSRVGDEVDVDRCREEAIPVLRRVSGGASIITGPGCLMYAVTLDLAKRPQLADLGAAHAFVLGRVVEAIRDHEPTARIAGTSDLACERDGGMRKFSGSSLRRVRDRLLYHGTLLYGFDLTLVPRLLRHAPRQPEYRAARPHADFITNLQAANRQSIVESLVRSWGVHPGEATVSERAMTRELVADKYVTDAWTHSR
ncbi:MAG: lipoate--protein ligase family protein [Planctomycetota bacterium]